MLTLSDVPVAPCLVEEAPWQCVAAATQLLEDGHGGSLVEAIHAGVGRAFETQNHYVAPVANLPPAPVAPGPRRQQPAPLQQPGDGRPDRPRAFHL